MVSVSQSTLSFPSAIDSGVPTVSTEPATSRASTLPNGPHATDITSTMAPSSDPSSADNSASGLGSNRVLLIALSTVLSVVGVLLLVGAVLLCLRYRKRRLLCFARGVTPIDDDEIATWKATPGEKIALVNSRASTTRAKHTSATSVKKPPSVIVYQSRLSQQNTRRSRDGSLHSFADNGYGSFTRTSFEKELPQTPLQAIAPNARAGLTDQSVPGDDPFLPSPRRHPSRLSKPHPSASTRSSRTHTRARSSRSSTRSFGDSGHYASDVELSPSGSHEILNSYGRGHGHSRIYSSSSIPPRLSLSDEGALGGLSPRPLFRDGDIGRAIG